MRGRVLPVIGAALLGLVLALGVDVQAQESRGRISGEERVAGEPYVPLAAEPPPGAFSLPWRTWATGQDLDYLRRFTLEISGGQGWLGGGSICGGLDYRTAFKGAKNLEVETRLNLTASISACLQYEALIFEGNYSLDDFTWSTYAPGTDGDISGFTVSTLTLGLNAALPLFRLHHDLLRVSKAVAPTGLTVFVHGGVGLKFFQSSQGPHSRPTGMGQEEIPLFESLGSPLFGRLGGGIGYRWTWFGIEVAAIYKNFGKPELTEAWLAILTGSAAQKRPDALDSFILELAVSIHL